MPNSLSPKMANELIAFIQPTNYMLAPKGDSYFSTSIAASTYVDGSQYCPSEGLDLCFDTLQGDSWESLDVTHDGELWHLSDLGMGGQSVSDASLEVAIRHYRSLFPPTSLCCPVELVVK